MQTGFENVFLKGKNVRHAPSQRIKLLGLASILGVLSSFETKFLIKTGDLSNVNFVNQGMPVFFGFFLTCSLQKDEQYILTVISKGFRVHEWHTVFSKVFF